MVEISFKGKQARILMVNERVDVSQVFPNCNPDLLFTFINIAKQHLKNSIFPVEIPLMCLQQNINFSVKVLSLCFFICDSKSQASCCKNTFISTITLANLKIFLQLFATFVRLTLLYASSDCSLACECNACQTISATSEDTLTLAILAVIAPNLICLSNSICFTSLEDWSKHVLSAETVSPPPSSLIVTTSTAAPWLEMSQLLAQSVWVCGLFVNGLTQHEKTNKK